MTWGNRLRLLLGLIVVLVIVAAGTLAFNQRITGVPSTTAEVAAQSYPVGTDYGGIITRAFVADGDAVKEGDPLFEVQSLTLQRDLATGAITGYHPDIRADGTVTVRATVAGVMAGITAEQGSFAQAGSVLGTVERTGTEFVTATFKLTPRDFARIEEHAKVDLRLPDQRTVSGTVDDLTVETLDGDAIVTARISSKQLTAHDAAGIVLPGMPLDATLRLRDDGPLAGFADAWSGVVQRLGG